MLGMLIAIGRRPNCVAADSVVVRVVVFGVDESEIAEELGVMCPAAAADGRGGGVRRFA